MDAREAFDSCNDETSAQVQTDYWKEYLDALDGIAAGSGEDEAEYMDDVGMKVTTVMNNRIGDFLRTVDFAVKHIYDKKDGDLAKTYLNPDRATHLLHDSVMYEAVGYLNAQPGIEDTTHTDTYCAITTLICHYAQAVLEVYADCLDFNIDDITYNARRFIFGQHEADFQKYVWESVEKFMKG